MVVNSGILPTLPTGPTEHVLRKIHHCTFRSQKWTPLSERPFYQKICNLSIKFLFIQENFRMIFFVTVQTSFHHCTFRFITAHFVHHCTLKQALRSDTVKVQLLCNTFRKSYNFNCGKQAESFEWSKYSIHDGCSVRR